MRGSREPQGWAPGGRPDAQGDVDHSKITAGSLPEAIEPMVEYYRSISGEHSDWDDYRTAMIKQHRCLIRITLTKAGPTVFG